MIGGFLHTETGVGPVVLWVLVTVATLGTSLLLGLALAAFVQRRSRPYLLLVAAFAVLFARSVVAIFTAMGLVSSRSHHLIEHGIDVILVAFVVAAVYYARRVSPEVPAS